MEVVVVVVVVVAAVVSVLISLLGRIKLNGQPPAAAYPKVDLQLEKLGWLCVRTYTHIRCLINIHTPYLQALSAFKRFTDLI